MQTSLKSARIRSAIDHFLILLVIIFGTLAVTFSDKADVVILEKIQLLFLCKNQ